MLMLKIKIKLYFYSIVALLKSARGDDLPENYLWKKLEKDFEKAVKRSDNKKMKKMKSLIVEYVPDPFKN